MIPDGYRILIDYDQEKQRFIAWVPELSTIKAEASTRTEALSAAEQQLEQAFRQAAENAQELPKPISQTEFNGELQIKISPNLHKELATLASQDKVEINQIVSEMLSAGVTRRSSPPRKVDSGQPPAPEHERRDSYHRRGKPRGNQYFNIMDDKASFIEYVRGLESGGQGSNRRGGRGRKP